MTLKEFREKEKAFTNSMLKPWQQWVLGFIFFLLGVAAIVLYVLYQEGML